MDYKICWLTLNRACNLRCKWCYAKSTHFNCADDITLEMAKQIVDICKDLNINRIALIGGEPTLYPQLPQIIEYIKSNNMGCGIITNGVKLEDKAYLQELMDVGVKSFSISLKGENKTAFKQVTGFDCYEKVKKGITNCIENNIDVSVSMVLTEENIETFLEGIIDMKKLGVKNFHLSFCYELDTSCDYKAYLKTNNPKKLINNFVKIYNELDEVTEHNFTLFQGYPLCLWDKNVLELMDEKNQLTTICQLLNRDGLIFDSKGYLIPCNAMPNIKLGRLNEDFCTAEELLQYSNQADFIAVYDKLCGLPSKDCLKCEDLANCGGGCVCQWSNYSYSELLQKENVL